MLRYLSWARVFAQVPLTSALTATWIWLDPSVTETPILVSNKLKWCLLRIPRTNKSGVFLKALRGGRLRADVQGACLSHRALASRAAGPLPASPHLVVCGGRAAMECHFGAFPLSWINCPGESQPSDLLRCGTVALALVPKVV